MNKQLLFVLVIFSALSSLIAAKEVVLGSNGQDRFTTTYVEKSGDEAIRLRFRMQKGSPLGYERAAAAV